MSNLRSKLFDRGVQDWLVDIDDFFIQSSVSYYGLNTIVPHFSRAASVMKGRSLDSSRTSLVESCALLYGLLHQRYVLSDDGMRRIYNKYQIGVYGKCPRVACKGKHLIPMGLYDEPSKDNVKCWCPSCHDVYETDIDLDGAYFGPDLPMMFHKIINLSLKYKAFSTFLKDDDDVPEIQQRLYRWGEKHPEPNNES